MKKVILLITKRIRLIAGILGIIFSLIGFSYLLHRDSPQSSFSGLDILHDCSAEPKGFIALQVLRDSQDVLVSMNVQNWDSIYNQCKSLEFHFPGRTRGHSYLVNIEDWNDPRIGIPGASSRPLRNALLTHDSLLNQDIIRIDPSKLEEFAGEINFTWIGGLQRTDFGKYKILLQFSATDTPNLQLKHTLNFKVSLVSPNSIELSSQVPQASGLKALGNASYHWFEIVPGKTLLSLSFEDSNKARIKELLLIILATVFGIGCTIVVEETISFIRSRNHSSGVEIRKNRKNY